MTVLKSAQERVATLKEQLASAEADLEQAEAEAQAIRESELKTFVKDFTAFLTEAPLSVEGVMERGSVYR